MATTKVGKLPGKSPRACRCAGGRASLAPPPVGPGRWGRAGAARPRAKLRQLGCVLIGPSCHNHTTLLSRAMGDGRCFFRVRPRAARILDKAACNVGQAPPTPTLNSLNAEIALSLTQIEPRAARAKRALPAPNQALQMSRPCYDPDFSLTYSYHMLFPFCSSAQHVHTVQSPGCVVLYLATTLGLTRPTRNTHNSSRPQSRHATTQRARGFFLEKKRAPHANGALAKQDVDVQHIV